MKLKSETRVTTHVDYNDLEKFVCYHMDFKEFNIACIEELGNDVTWVCNVTGELSEYDKKDLQDNILGKDECLPFETRTVLNHLCSMGHMKPGEYSVRVSW